MADAPFDHPVRILFLDVDGTMTNGVIGFTKEGDHRSFLVRARHRALEWARSLGACAAGRDLRPRVARRGSRAHASTSLEAPTSARARQVAIAERSRANRRAGRTA